MNWTICVCCERRKNIAVLVVWVLSCFVRCSGAQDFKIDNRVRIEANDCYTRIAIGSRMPNSAVTSTVPANSLSDCEAACSGNRTVCNAFSFGIDARGNGTCKIGRMDLNLRGNDLVMDPDYDVYERRPKMPRGCQHDRLLKISLGARMPITNSGKANNTVLSRQQVNLQENGQGMMMMMEVPNRRPQNPFGKPFVMGGMLSNDSPRDPSFFRGGWYFPIADDTDSRLYDIINNKNNYKSNKWKQTHQHDESLHEHYSDDHHSDFHLHVQMDDEDERNDYLYRSSAFGPGSSGIDNKWMSDKNSKWIGDIAGLNSKGTDAIPGVNSKWTEVVPGSNPKWNERLGNFGMEWIPGFFGPGGIQKGISYLTSTIPPGLETRGPFYASAVLGFSTGVTTVDPILEETKPCYRKLLTGKRLADSHVRRNFQCSRIEECHRVCEYESTFICEGFNYGQIQEGSSGVGRHGDRSHMCQLTSLSGSRMDPHRDFIQDPRYDYYERDWRCPMEKPAQGGSDWSSEPQRPLWYPPRPFPPVRRPPNEISRPVQRPNDRYPSSLAPATNPHHYLPEKPRPPIIHPNDYDYYSGTQNYLPQRPQNEVVHYHRPSQSPQSPQRPTYLPNPNYYNPGSGPSRPGTYSKFPDRRIDQNRWVRPQPDSRPSEIRPDRNWQIPHGQYLPNKDWPESDVYGPSYGYDSNRYDGRFPDRDPPRRHGDFYHGNDKGRPSKPPTRPVDQQDYYGYHYGPAYGYEESGHHNQHSHYGQHGQQIDSYVPSWKPQFVGNAGWGGSRDCSVRSATGVKVARNIVDTSYTTENLEECEMLCASRTDCQSFAYRYSLAASAPTDNCLLSGISFSKLNFYTDLVPDRDYDIYAIISDLRNCQGSRKPDARPHQHQRPEECFWRVRSGFGIPVSLTRKELRVDNGLGECQVACVSTRHFTCRSFVFRYESDRDRGPNCFLSDCPSSEIIQEEGAGLPRIDQAELYERGSYGRGCEPYPFTTIYNPSNFNKPKPWNGGNNHVGPNPADESCYSGYQNGCKLSSYAVSSITRVDSETECRRKCSRMRNHPHSPCMSFSFKIGDEKRGDNCYLSDVPRKDLRPGLDYVHDDDYVMYAWKELEPQCSSGPVGYPPYGGSHTFYQDSAGPTSGSWPGGSSSDGRPPHLGPGTGYLSYNHLVLGIRPLDPDKPDPPSLPDYLSHSPSPQNYDGYFSGFGSSYPDGFASFNRHYTVNGLPCKRGTKCERNQLVGFWSCEPEGSDLGSWDYCCEPNHHCGFSQGYRYPWCYVGPSEDQWRPCSDKYFPYLPSPRPAIRPNQHDHRQPSYQSPGQNSGYEDSTTYHSRHWPIAFLHPQPPPNNTDSVALADDRRDDPQRTNTSKHQLNHNNETRAPSTERTNSPITHLQLQKSHLKRRGLVQANKTRLILPKNAVKKIRRITIIPANGNTDFATQAPSYGTKYTAEKLLDSRDSRQSSYHNRTKTTRKSDGFEVIHLGASLPDVNNARKRTGNLGRVERVTKLTKKSTVVDDETRGKKNNTGPQRFLDDFDAVSGPTDKRSSYVPVALKLHASNDSSREV